MKAIVLAKVQQPSSGDIRDSVINCWKQTRRGGRVAEGGGLLILPALFVHTAFHVF